MDKLVADGTVSPLDPIKKTRTVIFDSKPEEKTQNTQLPNINDIAIQHNKKGSKLASEGKTEEAMAEYNTAIQLNPSYAKAYANKASLYKKTGQPSQAIVAYQAAIQHSQSQEDKERYQFFIDEIKRENGMIETKAFNLKEFRLARKQLSLS